MRGGGGLAECREGSRVAYLATGGNRPLCVSPMGMASRIRSSLQRVVYAELGDQKGKQNWYQVVEHLVEEADDVRTDCT